MRAAATSERAGATVPIRTAIPFAETPNRSPTSTGNHYQRALVKKRPLEVASSHRVIVGTNNHPNDHPPDDEKTCAGMLFLGRVLGFSLFLKIINCIYSLNLTRTQEPAREFAFLHWFSHHMAGDCSGGCSGDCWCQQSPDGNFTLAPANLMKCCLACG